jgi:predicted N-formylglutamate amidohydrolase
VRVAAEDVFLALEDGPAVRTENTDGASPVLLVCEHAANRIPRTLGTLDLDPSVLQSHVAWDPGAYEVALLLARSLDATLISSRFSRLVYDVNRPPDSPQAIRAASEIYDIPANQNLSAGERNARIEAIYRPFHDAIAERIEARAAKGRPSVLVRSTASRPSIMAKSARSNSAFFMTGMRASPIACSAAALVSRRSVYSGISPTVLKTA